MSASLGSQQFISSAPAMEVLAVEVSELDTKLVTADCMQWCTATPLGRLELYLRVSTCVHIMLVYEALVCPMHACVVTTGLS